MRRIIGRFKPGKAGGWEGEIRTLGLQAKVRFVPNDDRVHPNAPAFQIMLGWSGVGRAWETRSRGEIPKDFLRVEIDGPVLPMAMNCALFYEPDGAAAVLVWDRERQTRPPHAKAAGSSRRQPPEES